MKFPIIIMTKDEGDLLNITVNSIISSSSVDVQIYIVDNCSRTKEQLNLINELDLEENITVIRNKRNHWVLGLNKTISRICKETESKYFVLTDGDIDFSKCVTNEKCWLTYLISQMDRNVSLGKLGLSLDWSMIEKDNRFKKILEQEKSLYNKEKMINELFVSQVDTTAAIYRWDWSIGGEPCFYPDHIRYLRPELYSCRTPRNITVKHLGWNNYFDNKVSKELIDDKVQCFTVVGGSIKPEIKKQASKSVRIFHSLFARVIHKAWIIRRYMVLYKYITVKGRVLFDGQESTTK